MDDDVSRALILKLAGEPGGFVPAAGKPREIHRIDDAERWIAGGGSEREAQDERRQQMDG